MKKLIVAAVFALAWVLFASAQAGDYPVGLKITYADGTVSHWLCNPSGGCVMDSNNAVTTVSQINMGTHEHRAYILHLQ